MASTPCTMTVISYTPQPMSWKMFARLGSQDSRVPNSPRSTAIAGAPVRVPTTPASAVITMPATVPSASASSEAGIGSGE